MAHGEKSAYYQALKNAGHTFHKHYRDFTTEQLKEQWEAVAEMNGLDPRLDTPAPRDALPPRVDEVAELRAQLRDVTEAVQGLTRLVTAAERREERSSTPVASAGERLGAKAKPEVKPLANDLDPNQHAGATLNTHTDDDVIEIDAHGNRWFQKEVTKPAFPKPRGRRVLRYDDPGVAQEQIKVGEYVETFEVAGDVRNARPSEIKITLPSYQTGIYQPPNMPFKVHTYNGTRGFDLFDVQNYYGGSDLVPDSIKRCYVSTDLCYDITSTIRTIENEYRERVLRAGKGL